MPYVQYPAAGGGGGGGGVSSVALTGITNFISVSGSPITSSGTLALGLTSQVKNTVLVGPATGANAAPTFRALVAADLPTGNLTESTSAVLTISGGGSSVIGAGTTIQVAQASGSVSGYLSSTDWTTFNNKQAAITTLSVANGGTGNTTFTAYSVICAGTTATGAFQNVSGLGSSGNVLTSNGPAALPTWQAVSSGATTTLNNIGSVLASADINPSADNVRNLGTDTNRWGIGYFATRVGVGTAYPTTGVHNTMEFDVGTDGTSAKIQGYIKGSSYGDITLGTGGSWTITGNSTTLASFATGQILFYAGGLQVNSGDVSVFSRQLRVATLGQGLAVKAGSNGKSGSATLTAGSVVVSNTSVTAASHIHVCVKTPGGTQTGAPYVSSVTVGTGFTVTAAATDTSVIGYDIIEEL